MKPSRTAKFAKLGLLLFLALPTLTKGVDEAPYLSAEDVAQEQTDRERGPALSSALADPNPWQTYNQWMCFDRDVVRSEEVQIKTDDEWKPWPQITVNALGQRFDFSPETDLPVHAPSLMSRWNGLLQETHWVCIYAAFLQYLEPEEPASKEPYSLWIIERVKTEQGNWSITE